MSGPFKTEKEERRFYAERKWELILAFAGIPVCGLGTAIVYLHNVYATVAFIVLVCILGWIGQKAFDRRYPKS